jgi:hypothetical protein
MKHVVSHDLGQEKAKKVAQAAFDSYKQRYSQYNPKVDWIADNRANISFNVKGMTMNGTISVSPTTIEMDMDVPFMLRPFKGVALGVIEEEIKSWIRKAQVGEI